jgi:hypothetical protein
MLVSVCGTCGAELDGMDRCPHDRPERSELGELARARWELHQAGAERSRALELYRFLSSKAVRAGAKRFGADD